MKTNIHNLPKQPELFYLIESKNLIESDIVDISELEKYNGSVIGGYKLNFLSLYNTIVRQDIDKSSMIRLKLNKDIPNEAFKTEIFGSRILDYFYLGGNKTIINGICPNKLTKIDFTNLSDLLAELNVRKYHFLSIENPYTLGTSLSDVCSILHQGVMTINTSPFEIVKYNCAHENIKFNMLRYFTGRGEYDIPKKLFACRNCGDIFCICPNEKKFFDDKNLKQPKLCPRCREDERLRNMRFAAV